MSRRVRQGTRKREQAYLEDHDAGVPALGLGLLHARSKRGRGDEAVGRVGGGAGLADDELLEVDTVLLDLEHRRARECTAGLGEEALAVRVETLVVELDVVLSTEQNG